MTVNRTNMLNNNKFIVLCVAESRLKIFYCVATFSVFFSYAINLKGNYIDTFSILANLENSDFVHWLKYCDLEVSIMVVIKENVQILE
jgi:hypothetical protein